MCGILGIAITAGEHPSITRHAVERMRDTMTHRGPDGAGFWNGGNIILAHRRLAVVDPSPAGAQPMATPDGRFTIVYNGELYNDPALRAALSKLGITFRGHSDTETLLMALATWGPSAITRLRGMYALALFDAREQTLLLARDPLGIKPIYYRAGHLRGQPSIIFASEIPAILAHPDVVPQPDLITVSAYLTTIRTVLGERTLFHDIRTLRPGEVVAFDLKSESLQPRRLAPASGPSGALPANAHRHAPAPLSIRDAVEDSLSRHLRADVPLCCLLSGGLDSSILAMLAMRRMGALRTYCSGAAPTSCLSNDQSDDFTFARSVAANLGSDHSDVPITRRLFSERWPEMVHNLGTPLSTPNEVAIHEVSRRLRHDGNIVALSGEGADELFGGYAAPLHDALAYINNPAPRKISPGTFQLTSNAWMSPELKPGIINPHIWRSIEADGHLTAFYDSEFAAAAADGPARDDTPLQAHLRFHRRINLAGLLQRLDTATMLASVEGRTPFADAVICQLAESLPMTDKFAEADRAAPGAADASTTPEHKTTAPRTKLILRRAFAPDLPPAIIARPKHSFPLPFQDWVADHASALQECALARELFTPEALHAITGSPSRIWHLSWPMINIALWAKRWWG